MASADDTVGCDDNDICPICRQLLYRPAKYTACRHEACSACLSTWLAVSGPEPRLLDASFRLSTEPGLDAISFGCPVCRTATTIAIDEARSSQLESRYPTMYQERAMQDDEPNQVMIIQLGNTHREVPPSPGMARTHHWTFFLNSSHTDLIDSVDTISAGASSNYYFISLRGPPFTRSFLRSSPSYFTAFITLRDGWEWESPDAINSASRARGSKDRLLMEWCPKWGGGQLLALAPIRRSDPADDTLTSLRHLFATNE